MSLPHAPEGLASKTVTPLIGATLACLIFLVVSYASWARGGTRPELQAPIVVGGAILLAALVLLSLLSFRNVHGANRSAAIRSLMTDPILWAGLAFMALLTIQWLNSGRQLALDEATGRWFYSPPPRPGWPSAFAAQESAEMFAWFLPAWAIALTVRSPLMDRRHVWGLFHALAINAALLSAFGIVQFLSGAKAIFWTIPTGDRFFATFGYVNHGSAFFVLATAISIALLLRECFGRHHRPRRWAIMALLVVAMLNMVGAHLSFCRAGMAFVWILTFLACLYAARRARKDMAPVMRTYLVVGMLAVILVAALAVMHMAFREVTAEIANREMAGDTSGGDPVADTSDSMGREFSWRDYFIEGRDRTFVAAWNIWMDNFWFGVGGWGFARLLALYVPQSLWSWVAGSGWANVHNDPLQFLVEFGFCGGGLLCFAVVVLTIAIVKSGVWRRGAAVMILAGCSMVWLHSLIDLPFRCPAILFSWTLLLAALPVLKLSEIGSGPGADNGRQGCRPLRAPHVQRPNEEDARS